MSEELAGDWYNEFGSHLRLVADPAGRLTGTFTPGAGPGGRRDLVGQFDVGTTAAGIALGWTVAWRDEYGGPASVTSWSGQWLPGEQRIVAGWLFTTATDPDEAWKATVIGRDTFLRRPSSGAAGRPGA
ncbi:avidin/streptavidin family protein [Kitasatospora paranensis]|uniref:Avidin/streptavidin family protein n=1 Tax=Kitasatospora paranensis TaxID=258053 RepID=A0ABW2FP38_9ACTN